MQTRTFATQSQTTWKAAVKLFNYHGSFNLISLRSSRAKQNEHKRHVLLSLCDPKITRATVKAS